MTTKETMTCEVCEHIAPASSHPCQFGARSGPCSCWRGHPCRERLPVSEGWRTAEAASYSGEARPALILSGQPTQERML